MEEFTHYTVMKNEAVDALECQDGKIYVDCTLGGGGHSGLILSRIQPNGRLIAFDVDEDAIKASSERLKDYKNLTIVKSSYTNIKSVLHNLSIEKITGGVLFDLGASYHQFHKGERGFSFSKEAPLDMRFNQDAEFSAYDVVNTYSEDDLVRIFSDQTPIPLILLVKSYKHIHCFPQILLNMGIYLFQIQQKLPHHL